MGLNFWYDIDFLGDLGLYYISLIIDVMFSV